mmetsp:Transcript_55986/g.90673  ORF Transcript_55986/g.90673 Transcript_55986/m.90673 type:complete len:89 (+) Transcript_55986:40-306(+)
MDVTLILNQTQSEKTGSAGFSRCPLPRCPRVHAAQGPGNTPDSRQTVPKTAQILEQRSRKSHVNGDLALTRQALCSVLQKIIMHEDKV